MAIRQTPIAALLLVLFVCEVWSATPRQQEQAIAIAREVEIAGPSLAPELAADVLLTLVETNDVAGVDNRRLLLDRAFMLATKASEDAAIRYVGSGRGFLGEALNAISDHGLDRVALCSRAVKGLVNGDFEHATRLFLSIPLPNTAVGRCSAPYINDFSVYYEVMAALAESAPTAKVRESFLSLNIANLHSFTQVASLLSGLLKHPSTLQSWCRTLSLQVSNVFEVLPPDEVSFTANLASSVETINTFAAHLPGDERRALMKSTRDWITRGLAYGICTPRESTGHEKGLQMQSTLSAITTFNTKLASLGFDPIDHATARIHFVPEVPDPLADSPSPDEARFAGQEGLLWNDGVAKQDWSRWEEERSAYVAALARWNLKGSDVVAFYLEKSHLLERALLLETVFPLGPSVGTAQRGRLAEIVTAFADGAEARVVYAKRPVVWFAPILNLLGSYEHSDDLDAKFRMSHSPALRLYGMLGELLSHIGTIYH